MVWFLKEALASSILVLTLYLSLVLQPTADNLNLTPITSNCTGGSYARNSPFGANLVSLLSSLSLKSSFSNSALANVSTAGDDSDSAYGVFMCRGDLTSSDCSRCVREAATNITQSCASTRQAIIWYDYCLLRYSDVDFFGTPDANGLLLVNGGGTSSGAPLAAVTELVESAALQRQLMFASSASPAESLYAMAQCTADLTVGSCGDCLRTIISYIKSCCSGRKGWRLLAGSCWVRYEAYPFLLGFNGTYTEIVRSNCSASDFAPNSLEMMGLNLDELLSNLTSRAQPTGFYNAKIGQLYGLALCRGNLNPPNQGCATCLQSAGGSIASDCANSTGGIIWYEKCLVRYSDDNFFGEVDMDGQTLCGVNQISQTASDATIKLARSLTAVVADGPLMFATRDDAVLSSYVLLQCTRDLGGESCKKCLDKGLSDISTQCNRTNGWRYLSGSCTLRYEGFPFYNTTTIQSLAPPPVFSPQAPPPVFSPQAPPPVFSPQDKGGRVNKKSSHSKLVVILVPILGAILLSPLLYYIWWRLTKKDDRRTTLFSDINPLPNKDLPLIDLSTILAATSNFSDENKLGEGGFGPVYKGTRSDGTEIAVKRLSAKSKQGTTEFKNEVKLIAKLQHRNLVRMLGFCAERKEKLLVYEFLPNRSLDAFLFDPYKRAQLIWNRRFNIISGIARGLLYLHEDSLLKVIHRDLKASNVLLDSEMNAKISDFGLAKIYGADESEANTNRIVGTYGYMAPEYAMDGLFSAKSDVYSFGVLLLEIVSGQKNGRAHFETHGKTLLRHAWQLWNEKNATELIDPLLDSSYPVNEAMKCIQIGLLCVQENAKERPSMLVVVHMLQGEDILIPQPEEPPTFIKMPASGSSRNHSSATQSINGLTESVVEPR